MVTTLVCLMALSADATANLYPLAAALVLDGKLAIADVPTRQLTYVPLEGLSPQQADLSYDKQHIVVSATEPGGDATHLYLVDVPSGQNRKLAAGDDTRQSYPRFADNGASVVFTSSTLAGPTVPDRVKRLRIADGSIEDIAGQPAESNRIPVAWDKTRVAYITGGASSRYDLHVETVATQKQRVMAHLSGLTSELTTSPDQKKLLYTNKEKGRLQFYLAMGNAAPKALASIHTDADGIQPRFVCPRDVLFVSDRKVWVLNSDSGAVAELSGFDVPAKTPDSMTAADAKP